MVLKNKRIAVCATRRAESVIERVVRLGGKAYLEDAVKMVYLPEDLILNNIKRAIEEEPEIFYFTTGDGVEVIMEKIKEGGIYELFMNLMSKGKVFARGYKVRGKLISYGFKNFQSVESTKGFINVLKSVEIAGRKVFVQMYGQDMPELESFLEKANARMLKVWIYRYETDTEKLDAFIDKLLEGFYHAVLFTSAYQVEYIFERAKERKVAKELRKALNRKVIACAVGKTTAEKLFHRGVLRVFYPEKERLSFALDELERAFENG